METTTVDDKSDDEVSDNDLKIVTSPKVRKKMEIKPEDKHIIGLIEKEFEENIEFKASKSNLTTMNVKNILKQVATNEHVIAMVRQLENPDLYVTPSYEPKLTRSKAKELFSSNTSLPWLTPTRPPSEVHKLIAEELDEDSSGDEYVPVEEESEDDRDSSVISENDLRSVSPPTPLPVPESPKEVSFTEDGVFKIPPPKTQETLEEEANIALRTRSKLSLSSTPLEVIEEAFIPPDITTDMYDMHCDDDDWRDFLKKFTRPLDEVAKPTEDEDHDPEYNILADENINEIDTEELRADKAVKISKKELNELIAELFDGTEFGEDQDEHETVPLESNIDHSALLNNCNATLQNPQSFDTAAANNLPTIQPSYPIQHNFMMQVDQKMLLEQQMRQHVQMLTQNFLLTYQYPEYHGVALKVREFLVNLILLAGSKEDSVFKACNLENALRLVDDWENQFSLNTDEIKSMREYVCRVQQETKQCWSAGTHYVPTFPPLILRTISNSNVFLYPSLLPRIPFKSSKTHDKCSTFSESEEQLIALGLEQFEPYLAEETHNLTFRGEVRLKLICSLIAHHMMPAVTINRIYHRILNLKNCRSGMNAIKYYYRNKKAPVTMHYVIDISEFGDVPPCKRSPNVLPIHWRNYIYPETIKPIEEPVLQTIKTFTKVPKPPAFNKLSKKITPDKNTKASCTPIRGGLGLASKKARGLFCSTPKENLHLRKKKLEEYFKSPQTSGVQNKDNCVSCIKFNSSIFRKLKSKTNQAVSMFPSMPGIGVGNNTNSSDVNPIDFGSNLQDSSEFLINHNGEADGTVTINVDEDDLVEKDNEEDISALMVASSTINNMVRRNLTGAEKKKAKLCREYNATLAMLKPEDPSVVQQRAQSYAQAYFDKAREHLNPQEYVQFMEVLNNFTEGTGKVVDVYKQMEVLLAGKHQDLLDEFLSFLTSSQAKDVGKLILYYKLGNMTLFLHKLETYFKDQPAQLRKIYRSLTDLSTCVNVTMDRVKNTIMPLLKGNSLLIDWFLQIFPTEPPPKSLLEGAWEQVDIRGEFIPNKDLFETITVPDEEDVYGGPNCICACHEGDNISFKSRLQHCTPCGLKFMQGRVYVQTEKGLRLANVSFPGSSDIDHNLRLNCPTLKKRKRSETSPAKQLTSPTKDTTEEARLGCDSDDEGDCPRKRNRISRSPRKRKVKIHEKPEIIEHLQSEIEEAPMGTIHDDYNNVVNIDLVNKVTFKDDEGDLFKHTTDEIQEWDCNTSIESAELRHSPEHSVDSESEFCEESSQDNINTETDDTGEELESCGNSPVHSESSNSNTFVETMWTREEDKLILETFQKKVDKEEAFVSISNILAYRTLSDIKERFNTLLSILQNLASSESSVS